MTVGTAAPAHAGDPASQSARWLNKQLTNGLVHNDQFDFDDYGLSIDVGIALGELELPKSSKAVSKALAEHVDSYTTGVDFASSDIYAGPVAKSAAFAQTTGADATDFGGVNLIKRLSRRVANQAPIVGRIQDKGVDDFANIIGQAYAVQALTTAKAKKARKATAFLLAQQCKGGYFRLNFTEDKTAADQTCDGGSARRRARRTPTRPRSRSWPCSTLPQSGRAVDNAIDGALSWLLKTQATNGSFGGGHLDRGPERQQHRSGRLGAGGQPASASGRTRPCPGSAS